MTYKINLSLNKYLPYKRLNKIFYSLCQPTLYTQVGPILLQFLSIND